MDEVTKAGGVARVTVEQFLRNPAGYQRQQADLMHGFIARNLFGPPWLHADTWRGWPARFTITPRLDRLVDQLAEARARVAGAIDVLRYGVPDPDDYR